jgi:hypothetical protein
VRWFIYSAQITFRSARAPILGAAGGGKKKSLRNTTACMANEMLDALICLQPIAYTQHAYNDLDLHLSI